MQQLSCVLHDSVCCAEKEKDEIGLAAIYFLLLGKESNLSHSTYYYDECCIVLHLLFI